MSFLRRGIQALAIPMAALSFLSPSQAVNTGVDDLLKMTDQLDQMDKADFDQALLDANRCTKARDFACSEAQLRVARKVANGTNARNQLRQAEEGLVAEKKQVEEELLALERRQKELERAEARLRETERQAQAARDADSGMSTAEGAALFAGLLSQSLRNQAAGRAMEQANTRRFDAQQADVAANIARDQQRFAQERARLEAQRSALQQQQRQVSAPPAPVRLTPPQSIAQATPAAPTSTAREGQDLTPRSSQPTQRDVAIVASAPPQTMPPAGAPRTGPTETTRTAAGPSAADASAADMPEALAFCWQTKQGNWLCDGKSQDTTLADKDLDAQIALVNCKQPVRLTRDMVTLTSLRVAAWGQKSGWLYSCGEKLQPGNTGHVTWNRDIRRFWDGIKF